MNILTSTLLIVAAMLVLVLGLVSVVHDLIERGPYESPLVKNDTLAWPPRYQRTRLGTAESGEAHRGGQRFAGAVATWPDHESDRS